MKYLWSRKKFLDINNNKNDNNKRMLTGEWISKQFELETISLNIRNSIFFFFKMKDVFKETRK